MIDMIKTYGCQVLAYLNIDELLDHRVNQWLNMVFLSSGSIGVKLLSNHCS